MRRPWRNIAVALFALAIALGGVFGNRVLALTDEGRDLLRLYTELVTVAHDAYGSDVSYQELVHSSINGMLRTLDPHTSFLSAEAYANMRERQQSSFYGLGILVGMRDGMLTVITPIEGTPASRLGMQAGDVIEAIEGEPTKGLTLDDAVAKLKGPRGTEVTITVVRGGLAEPLELTITRDEIPQNTVRYAYMITPETGYLAISDFNRGTGKEVAEALASLREQGMKSLLVDLRGNGGGLLDQAIEVADQFLPEGAKIVETRGRTRDSFQEYKATRATRELGLPVVVLVGQGTASAAEILAGAIQDHDIGLIVGVPTWGKGLVQTVYSLSYDSGLALTTAEYYTPSGRLIQRDYSSWFDYAARPNSVGLSPSEPPSAEREVYRTDLGRAVYGGGGITPDVLVEPAELSATVQFLLSRNAFFNYAVGLTQELEIESPDWEPGADRVDDFRDWLLSQGVVSADEIGGSFEEPETRIDIERYLRAEIFNAAFGLEERYKVLARGDRQIERALGLLGEASELLARRRGLERERPIEIGASAVGTG